MILLCICLATCLNAMFLARAVPRHGRAGRHVHSRSPFDRRNDKPISYEDSLQLTLFPLTIAIHSNVYDMYPDPATVPAWLDIYSTRGDQVIAAWNRQVSKLGEALRSGGSLEAWFQQATAELGSAGDDKASCFLYASLSIFCEKMRKLDQQALADWVDFVAPLSLELQRRSAHLELFDHTRLQFLAMTRAQRLSIISRLNRDFLAKFLDIANEQMVGMLGMQAGIPEETSVLLVEALLVVNDRTPEEEITDLIRPYIEDIPPMDQVAAVRFINSSLETIIPIRSYLLQDQQQQSQRE